MRIVVTGGAGKIGRWVVRELLGADSRQSHEVVVFDRAPLPPEPGLRSLVGDICDLGQVFGALAGADAVVHLAAVGRPGIATDDVTFRTNVVGTFNVHEAAYRQGIRRVVSTSSESVLGWDYRLRDFLPDYLPVDEDHPVRPQDAYGLSKQAGENVALAYARKGLETLVLRPSWVALPEEIELVRRAGGRPPSHFKLYCYVDVRDAARAFRLAIERPVPPGTRLFVVADDSSVAEPLCDLLPRLYPASREVAASLTGPRAGASNARAKEILGWSPTVSWRAQPKPIFSGPF